jgi:predicted butyrate kinase (DUF1464 family)
MANFHQEFASAINLLNPHFRLKFVKKILDALDSAVRTPDVEVKVTFDTSAEHHAGTQFLGKAIAGLYPKMVDYEKSAHGDGHTIEFLNGSAIRLLVSDG